jgi:hypothetical protein
MNKDEMIKALKEINNSISLTSVIERLNDLDVDYSDMNDLEMIIIFLSNPVAEEE